MTLKERNDYRNFFIFTHRATEVWKFVSFYIALIRQYVQCAFIVHVD
jgi:hypothetical protein